MDIQRYKTVEKWYLGLREEGFAVSIMAPGMIQQAMKAFGWNFHEALGILLKEGIIFQAERLIACRLDGIEILTGKYPRNG